MAGNLTQVWDDMLQAVQSKKSKFALATNRTNNHCMLSASPHMGQPCSPPCATSNCDLQRTGWVCPSQPRIAALPNPFQAYLLRSTCAETSGRRSRPRPVHPDSSICSGASVIARQFTPCTPSSHTHVNVNINSKWYGMQPNGLYHHCDPA